MELTGTIWAIPCTLPPAADEGTITFENGKTFLCERYSQKRDRTPLVMEILLIILPGDLVSALDPWDNYNYSLFFFYYTIPHKTESSMSDGMLLSAFYWRKKTPSSVCWWLQKLSLCTVPPQRKASLC